MEEEILIQEILKGNQHAFRELVTQYQDKVYNTVFSFVQNEDDALDITQEVFVEIFLSLKNFRRQSSLATWIYRISVNKSLNFLQKITKKKQAEMHRQPTATHEQEPNTALIIDPNHPQQKMENKELAVLMKKIISNLPKNQRIAFLLYKYEELSYREIADIMQISLSSVESLIFRAKKGIQKKILKYLNP